MTSELARTQRVHYVTIYHDETKTTVDSPYRGHVLLFVPSKITTRTSSILGNQRTDTYPRSLLLEHLDDLRGHFKLIEKKLHYSDISGSQWGVSDQGHLEILNTCVDGLKCKSSEYFNDALHLKLAVVIYPKNIPEAVKPFYGGTNKNENSYRYDEHHLRRLLKYACCTFYNDQEFVHVQRIVTDGTPQYRQMNSDRVFGWLPIDELFGKSPIPSYVYFELTCEITHLPLSDHKLYVPSSDEYGHANFLQIADLLLGSTITYLRLGCDRASITYPTYGERVTGKKELVSQPVRMMLQKAVRGRQLQHSSHANSFLVSEAQYTLEGLQYLNRLSKASKIAE